MATMINMATVKGIELLADLFHHHCRRVKKEPSRARKEADLAVARGDERYIVELKASGS